MELHDRFDDKIVKVLVLTNPLSYLILGVYGICYVIWYKTCLDLLYIYWFTLNNPNKQTLITIINNLIDIKKKRKLNKWEGYITSLILNKCRKLYNKKYK